MTYLETAWREGRMQATYRLTESQRLNADTTPYGVAALTDADRFAAACYNENARYELDLTGCKKSDHGDRGAWNNISAYDWAFQIGLAYEAMLWEEQHDMRAPE